MYHKLKNIDNEEIHTFNSVPVLRILEKPLDFSVPLGFVCLFVSVFVFSLAKW